MGGRARFALAIALLSAAGACGQSRTLPPSTHHDASHALAATRHASNYDRALAAVLAPNRQGFARDAGADAPDALVSEGFRATRQHRFDALGVRLPDDGSGWTDVGISRFAALTLRLRLEDAAPTAPELDAGRAVYPNARLDTDRVVGATDAALEDAFVLRSTRAPLDYTWHVERGTELASLELDRDGTIAVRDATNRARLRIAAPYVIDAMGDKRALAWTWDDSTSTLRLRVDARGLTYPLVLDPRIEAVAWESVVPPAPRAEAGVFAYDAARMRGVLVSRSNSRPKMITLTWDGTTWSDVSPVSSPTARFFPALSYDPVRQKVVLFGGSSGSAETWEWDGATWTMRTPATSPPGRSSAAMAYDTARSVTLLFGGAVNDTWAWNGTNWSKYLPASSPPARVLPLLANVPNRSKVLLFGGKTPALNATFSDTWEWDGTNWASKSPALSPTEAYDASGAFDPVTNTTWMFAPAGLVSDGDTWSWDGVNWMRRDSGQFNGAHIFYDTARAKLSLAVGRGSFEPLGVQDWTPSANHWTRQSGGDPGNGASLVWDPTRAKLLAFTLPRGEVWSWTGNAWSYLSGGGPVFNGQVAAWDGKRNELVLFEGETGGTWTWNGAWSQKSPAHTPSPRQGAAFAYDARNERITLFGGVHEVFSTGTSALYNDTWTWNGSDWTQLTLAVSPVARDGAAMTFDVRRNHLVLYGGEDSPAGDKFTDTWIFDTAWSQPDLLEPAGIIDPVSAYSTARDETILYGAPGINLDPITVAYDGTTWRRQAAPSAEQPTGVDGFAYDPSHDAFVAIEALGSTWILRSMGGTCRVDGDCAAGTYCTDGVCCLTNSCETCETCAGFSPGQCTTIFAAEDPDTCALTSGKSCDRAGTCRIAAGASATVPSECASGHIADGVCCESDCTTPCYACRADLKESGSRSGVCDVARDGTDAHDDCASDPAMSCQRDGMCDGHGGCRAHYSRGAACGAITCVDNRAIGNICDGLGACSESPQGVDCGAYGCDGTKGCKTSCMTNADCGARYRCVQSACVADRGVICADDQHLTGESGALQDCAPYKCEGAACKSKCTSIADCVFPAQCNGDGRCIPFADSTATPAGDGGGGCSVARVPAPTRASMLGLALALAFVTRRARRRS